MGTKMILSFCSSAVVRGNGTCFEGFELDKCRLSWVEDLESEGPTLEDEEGDDDEGNENMGSGSGSGGWRASSSANASALFDWILRTARKSLIASSDRPSIFLALARR